MVKKRKATKTPNTPCKTCPPRRAAADTVLRSGADESHKPFEFIDAIKPGVVLNLQGKDRNEAHYKLGALWVWSRTETEHYLVQTSHLRHCHRVQGVFWTRTMAEIVCKLVENGMKPGDLAAYTLLREAGVAPTTQYRDLKKRRV